MARRDAGRTRIETGAATYTELESTVLGLVGQHGPCTAYEIMRLFQLSPTATFRASSGSVYPLVKKLVRLGLLKTEASRHKGRKASLLSLTPAGRAALVAWLVDEPEGLADPSAEAIRSRLLFLAELNPAQRRAFVERALQLTDKAIGKLAGLIEAIPADEPFDRLVHVGALRQLEARRNWLKEILLDSQQLIG